MLDWVINVPLSIALSLDRLGKSKFWGKSKTKFRDTQQATPKRNLRRPPLLRECPEHIYQKTFRGG